jgi:hypothetical protein
MVIRTHFTSIGGGIEQLNYLLTLLIEMDITIRIFTTMEWAIPRRCLCLMRPSHHSGLTRRKKSQTVPVWRRERQFWPPPSPRKIDSTYAVAAKPLLMATEALLAASCNDLVDKWA